MAEKSKTAEQAAYYISNEANLQVLSHCVIALKQHIEEQLKADGSIKSIFEKKVSDLYGEDSLMNCDSHKAYVNSGLIDGLQTKGLHSFARIYPKIDKVPSVKDKSLSYAFHIDITAYANSSISYDSYGFIKKDCGRFAVGHDSGHIVVDLEHLIKDATIDGNTNSDVSSHYASDLFSYIQSDSRDFYLLELCGDMDLDKAFNDYKAKEKIKFDEGLDEHQKVEVLDKIRNIFDKSAELYRSSQRYSMSHVILALNNLINDELTKKPDKLRNELAELRTKIDDCKKRKLKLAMRQLTDEIKNTAKELDSLTSENPRVSIHLIVREDHEDLTIDCYNRRDENSNKDFYCFEITMKVFSKEEREGICRKLCEAIGCLYYGYDSVIKSYKHNNEIGHNIGTIAKMQSDFRLNKKEIDAFAKKLFELRKEDFAAKRKSIKENEKLSARLENYIK